MFQSRQLKSRKFFKIERLKFLNFIIFIFDRALVNCKKMKFFDLSFCTTITNFGENVQDLKTKFPNCTFKSSYQET